MYTHFVLLSILLSGNNVMIRTRRRNSNHQTHGYFTFAFTQSSRTLSTRSSFSSVTFSHPHPTISFVSSSSNNNSNRKHFYQGRHSIFSQDTYHHGKTMNTILKMSSIDDDGSSNNNNNGSGGFGNGGGGSNNKKGKGDLDDFLDPKKSLSESENLKKARAELSESSLPVSFQVNSESNIQNNDTNNTENDTDSSSSSNNDGKIILSSTRSSNLSLNNKTNPYLDVVSRLSPSELISKFTSTAHPRVQDAVRNTILGLIGNLPKMAFDTTVVTTGERLASLMFQLQMTGYMFKNADYRLSLSQTLRDNVTGSGSASYLLAGHDDDDDDDDALNPSISSGKVRGKIKISYSKNENNVDTTSTNEDERTNTSQENNANMSSSPEFEVDAKAYMSELRKEVLQLRQELVQAKAANEDTIRKDLLLYIRTLPQQELKTLTDTLSPDVLDAMKGLVNVVMSGIGDGENKIGPNTVTEQSGEAMAQLCMWQLVVGYNLRELEVREEMKISFLGGSSNKKSNSAKSNGNDEGDFGDASIDFGAGGFE